MKNKEKKNRSKNILMRSDFWPNGNSANFSVADQFVCAISNEFNGLSSNISCENKKNGIF